MRTSRIVKKFVALVTGLFLCFTLLFLAAQARGWTEGSLYAGKLEALSRDTGSRWLAGGVIALLLAGDLVLPVPSSVLMTLSGFFLGWPAGTAMAFAGAMGSALLGFGLCRRFGRRALRSLAGERDEARISRWLETHGAWAIILSRSVPMLTEVVSCVAGLSLMRFRRFALLSAAGTLPICAVYAWAGAKTGDAAGFGWAVLLAFVLPAAGLALARGIRRPQPPGAP